MNPGQNLPGMDRRVWMAAGGSEFAHKLRQDLLAAGYSLADLPATAPACPGSSPETSAAAEARSGLVLLDYETYCRLLANASQVQNQADLQPELQPELQPQKLSSWMDNVTDAIIATDLQSKIQVWNKSAEEIYGWTAAEMMGRQFDPFGQTPAQGDDPYTQQRQQLVEQGSWKGEVCHWRKDGQMIHILSLLVLMKDEQGQPVQVVAYNRNITLRRQSEQALRNLVTDNQDAMRVAKMAFWEYDLPSRIFTFNDQFYSLYGLSAQAAGGYQMHADTYIQRFWDPESAWELDKIRELALETRDPDFQYHSKTRVRRADGSLMWMNVWFRLKKDDQGHSSKLYGVVQDISEHEQTLQALQAIEQHLKRAQELAHLGYWTWDIQTDTVSWSDEMVSIFGMDPAGLPGDLEAILRARILPQDQSLVLGMHQAADHPLRTVEMEHRLVWPDGTVRYVLAQAADWTWDAQGRTQSISGVVQDITERKQAEIEKETLNTISRLFLAQGSLETIYHELVHTLAWRFDYPIAAIEHYHPGKAEMEFIEAVGVGGQEHRRMRVPVSQTLSGVVATTGMALQDLNALQRSEYSYKLLRDLGVITFLSVPLKFQDQVLGVLSLADTRRRQDTGTLLDTLQVIANHLAQEIARRQAEEALGKSEERFQTLVNLAPVGIFETNTGGDCIYANSRWLEIAGLDLEQVMGKGWIQALHPEDRDMVFQTWYEAVRDHLEWDHEYRLQTPQGKVTWVRGTSVTLRDDQDEIIGHLGVNANITDRKQSQAALETALAEKDTLLRELYHRTKNNMQVISSLLSLQEDYVEDPQLVGVLKDVRSRIQSMALVHQKLYQSQSLSLLDLGEYLQELAELLLRSYDVTCQVTLEAEVEAIPVLIDTAIPCGLILNELVTNALKYAFQGQADGVVKLWLYRAEDGRICIGVADNGVGLPAGFDYRKNGRLGFQTVLALAEMQLQGEFRLEQKQGVTCEFKFMNTLYTPRI